MASVWIRVRRTKDGTPRYGSSTGLVAARSLTGTPVVHDEAARDDARRVRRAGTRRRPHPDLDMAATADVTDVRADCSTWRASRVDVAASTSDQHRIQIDKLLPIIGTSRIDTLDAATSSTWSRNCTARVSRGRRSARRSARARWCSITPGWRRTPRVTARSSCRARSPKRSIRRAPSTSRPCIG